jgi:hypothetical protein
MFYCDKAANHHVYKLLHSARLVHIVPWGDNKCCYQYYVDPGLEVEEDERSFEQNEALGLNDMNTEKYHSGTRTCHESDKPEELSDRLNRLDTRGGGGVYAKKNLKRKKMGEGSAKNATTKAY